MEKVAPPCVRVRARVRVSSHCLEKVAPPWNRVGEAARVECGSLEGGSREVGAKEVHHAQSKPLSHGATSVLQRR